MRDLTFFSVFYAPPLEGFQYFKKNSLSVDRIKPYSPVVARIPFLTRYLIKLYRYMQFKIDSHYKREGIAYEMYAFGCSKVSWSLEKIWLKVNGSKVYKYSFC